MTKIVFRFILEINVCLHTTSFYYRRIFIASIGLVFFTENFISFGMFYLFWLLQTKLLFKIQQRSLRKLKFEKKKLFICSRKRNGLNIAINFIGSTKSVVLENFYFPLQLYFKWAFVRNNERSVLLFYYKLFSLVFIRIIESAHKYWQTNVYYWMVNLWIFLYLRSLFGPP